MIRHSGFYCFSFNEWSHVCASIVVMTESKSKMPGEEFWLIWFPSLLAGIVILALLLLSKLYS